MRCPTCRAEQVWSDSCRRCKSDLRLLRSVFESAEKTRAAARQHLASGRPEAALQAARQLVLLTRDGASLRLLADCHLACNQPALAQRITNILARQEEQA